MKTIAIILLIISPLSAICGIAGLVLHKACSTLWDDRHVISSAVIGPYSVAMVPYKHGDPYETETVMVTTTDFWSDFTEAQSRKIWHGRTWRLPFCRSDNGSIGLFNGRDNRHRSAFGQSASKDKI
jgi:hypothetical protein